MIRYHRAAAALLSVFLLTTIASAQGSTQAAITQADIQRLQDNIYLAERDLTLSLIHI